MISVIIFVTTLFVYVTKKFVFFLHQTGYAKKKFFFLFKMITLILGVLGLRLSLNVINIVVIVDS